jgi:hypothetical protein
VAGNIIRKIKGAEMNNSKKRSVVFLATIDNTADKSLTDFIEQKFGADVRINFLTSPKVYSTKNGLADKIKQYNGVGTVIAIHDSFDDEKLEIAIQTGIRFAVVFKNESGKWTGFYIERHRKNTSIDKTEWKTAVSA